MERLPARLDAAGGARVLCGRRDVDGRQACRVEIAHIRELPTVGALVRSVVMAPDWLPAHGRAPWRRSSGQAPGKTMRRPRVGPGARPPLPIRAQCPACGLVNTLGADALKVTDPEQR